MDGIFLREMATNKVFAWTPQLSTDPRFIAINEDEVKECIAAQAEDAKERVMTQQQKLLQLAEENRKKAEAQIKAVESAPKGEELAALNAVEEQLKEEESKETDPTAEIDNFTVEEVKYFLEQKKVSFRKNASEASLRELAKETIREIEGIED